jgi:hypothetical protein
MSVFGGFYATFYEAKKLETVRTPPKRDIKGGPQGKFLPERARLGTR